jgi:hypothetical protein
VCELGKAEWYEGALDAEVPVWFGVRAERNGLFLLLIAMKDKKPNLAARCRFCLVGPTPSLLNPVRCSLQPMIKHRLHISGLTPAISSHDLENRLGSFGSVLALDGFGKLDVLGQPRKFAYVTLETTKQQLSRCMWHPQLPLNSFSFSIIR